MKIHDLSELNESFDSISLDDDRSPVDHLAWSDDGQLLTISTQNGLPAEFEFLKRVSFNECDLLMPCNRICVHVPHARSDGGKRERVEDRLHELSTGNQHCGC